MAGGGTRYSVEGYKTPKPLIPVAGVPMVVRAIGSVDRLDAVELFVIALEEHERKYNISGLLQENNIKAELVLIPAVTEGQLCTVLSAEHHFAEEDRILIVPSDTYIQTPIIETIQALPEEVAGLISVYNLPGDRWSFAKTDAVGRVIEVAEKVRISDYASTGIYYFSNAAQFLKYAHAMVQGDERTKGEFYVIPVYGKMIDDGLEVRILEAQEMHDMGTPQAKLNYESILRDESRD